MVLFVPIGSGLTGGAIVVGVFALISAFALASVLLRVIWLCMHHRLSGGGTRSTEYTFFTTNLGCYAACLLIANTLNSVAGLLGLQWVVIQAVLNDWVCKFQVTVMQLGNWSTAFFTVAIALHTFNSLVLHVRRSALICGTTIFVGWAAAIIAALVPVLVRPDVYGPTEITCSFNPLYPTEKFLLHVLPILFGSLFSAALYSIVFLVLRGTLSFKGGIKFSVDPMTRWSVGTDTESYRRFVAYVARAMLWFPVAYIVLLVPYSIVQLLTISGFDVPFTASVVALVLRLLLGVVNALLTYYIFRVLEPAINSSSTTKRMDSSLLPVHRDFGTPASQQVEQLSEKERAPSRSSDYSGTTLPSQYSQSSTHYGQQGSSSQVSVSNTMSMSEAHATIGCHIVSQHVSETVSEPPILLEPNRRRDFQPRGLPASPRPHRTQPRRLKIRPRAWTVTNAAVQDNDDDSPRASVQTLRSAGSSPR